MDSRFIIYGRSSCPYCANAVSLLRSKGIKNVFFDFSEDQEAIQEAKSFYNWRTVPMVLENNTLTGETKFIGGYDDLCKRLNSRF